VAPLSKQKMSLATAEIYCRPMTSLPLSRAMEDSSIIQVQASSSCKSSIADGTVCIHVATTTHIRQLWNIVVAREHRRQDGGRWVGTMAKCQTATDERASQPWSRRSRGSHGPLDHWSRGPCGSQCSWWSTGVIYERRVPVTRLAAAFWTDYNRGTSVLLACARTELQ